MVFPFEPPNCSPVDMLVPAPEPPPPPPQYVPQCKSESQMMPAKNVTDAPRNVKLAEPPTLAVAPIPIGTHVISPQSAVGMIAPKIPQGFVGKPLGNPRVSLGKLIGC